MVTTAMTTPMFLLKRLADLRQGRFYKTRFKLNVGRPIPSGKGLWLSKEVKKRNSIDHYTDLVQEGLKLRQLIQTRASSNLFDWTPVPTFDSHKVSFFYYTFVSHKYGDLGEKYVKHIVQIWSKLDLNECQSAIFATETMEV